MQNTSFDNEADYSDDLDFPSSPETESCVNLTVPLEMAGGRLDAVLAKLMPDYSRSRLSSWIKEGAVIVNDKPAQPKDKMIGGELIAVTVRPSEENLAFTPEPMDLDIIYEDDTVIVINKPAGLVVHPAAGNWSGTLLNGLLAHCPELSQVPRAGIVHRLDKETSGLMVSPRPCRRKTHWFNSFKSVQSNAFTAQSPTASFLLTAKSKPKSAATRTTASKWPW